MSQNKGCTPTPSPVCDTPTPRVRESKQSLGQCLSHNRKNQIPDASTCLQIEVPNNSVGSLPCREDGVSLVVFLSQAVAVWLLEALDLHVWVLGSLNPKPLKLKPCCFVDVATKGRRLLQQRAAGHATQISCFAQHLVNSMILIFLSLVGMSRV